MKKRSKRHRPEQIVKKLRDAEVMLNNGKSMEEVIRKDHIVQSSGKKVPAFMEDIKVNDSVIFFTNFDKIISTGKVIRIKKSLITVQGDAPATGTHDVPLSAILILQQ